MGVEGRNQELAGLSQGIQEILTTIATQKLLSVGIVVRQATTKISAKLHRRKQRATLQTWWQMERKTP
jgi:hypothetical protein